jgi:formiminotetrahydrofolate cyclodeaminase
MDPNQARQMPTLELNTILAGISSTDPCPGAGAAGGVALALAAACARKAFRITASHEDDDVALLEADEELATIMAAGCQSCHHSSLLLTTARADEWCPTG